MNKAKPELMAQLIAQVYASDKRVLEKIYRQNSPEASDYYLRQQYLNHCADVATEIWRMANAAQTLEGTALDATSHAIAMGNYDISLLKKWQMSEQTLTERLARDPTIYDLGEGKTYDVLAEKPNSLTAFLRESISGADKSATAMKIFKEKVIKPLTEANLYERLCWLCHCFLAAFLDPREHVPNEFLKYLETGDDSEVLSKPSQPIGVLRKVSNFPRSLKLVSYGDGDLIPDLDSAIHICQSMVLNQGGDERRIKSDLFGPKEELSAVANRVEEIFKLCTKLTPEEQRDYFLCDPWFHARWQFAVCQVIGPYGETSRTQLRMPPLPAEEKS